MPAEEVDVPTAQEMWRAGDLVIDVRTPDEYARGHLPGAVNVGVDGIALWARAALRPGSQVVTTCSTGNRSWRAAQSLGRLGHTALSLTGGVKAWAAAGLPLASGPTPRKRPHRPGAAKQA